MTTNPHIYTYCCVPTPSTKITQVTIHTMKAVPGIRLNCPLKRAGFLLTRDGIASSYLQSCNAWQCWICLAVNRTNQYFTVPTKTARTQSGLSLLVNILWKISVFKRLRQFTT
ncbi:hypothetical protein NP493_372g03028 [Ridgeia piscesae]|uniref:Uncharacterized protein n=1 Tax=Ridgeia piscesae TaxID=27915 RepID=A0AAD9L3L8_RIDPI|nr:hypothetical protein NP493_372g03028 [Ridgeia piscesae]